MSDNEKSTDESSGEKQEKNRVVDSKGKTKGRVRYNPGRPKRTYPFEVARELARRENLGSVKQYLQWYKYNNPARMPKRPDRAYHRDFISWNDFLGNDNKFGVGQYLYKTYEETKKYARTLNLKTQADWTRYGIEHGFPDDIPKRPDLFYQKTYEWYTWSDFLGASAQTIIDEAKDTDRVIYIIRYNSTPSNVYQIGIVVDEHDVYINKEKMGFEIVKLYRCNSNFPLEEVIDKSNISEYPEGQYENMYIINNFYDLIHDLENAGVLFDITTI